MYENLLSMQTEYGQPKRKCLHIQKGIVLKVKKDVFFKIVISGRNTEQLTEFVQSKLQFLNKRIMFLAQKDYEKSCIEQNTNPVEPKPVKT